MFREYINFKLNPQFSKINSFSSFHSNSKNILDDFKVIIRSKRDSVLFWSSILYILEEDIVLISYILRNESSSLGRKNFLLMNISV